MKKAFTLIELLAVIIILAIVALIATPLILNVIEDAEKSANESQAYLLLNGAEQYYLNSKFEGTTIDESTNVYGFIQTSGVKPENGEVFIKDDGSISLAIYIDGYCYEKDYNESTISSEEMSDPLSCAPKVDLVTPEEPSGYVDVSGANQPLLSQGLVPVIISTDGTVTVADTNQEWYNYGSKEWANAVILNTTATSDITAGSVITLTDIAAYYVWIPRYEYQIFDTDADASDAADVANINSQGGIQIRFTETGIPMSSEPTMGEYYTHPAFSYNNGDGSYTQIDGFWVGKFELTFNSTILPNMTSLRNQNGSQFYSIIDSFEVTHNLVNIDSHMMKNMEWGAVAYLSYSKYGTCIETSCTEITPHTNASYLTGGGDYVANINQSTTGNITGIYDMSGGTWEYVMGVNNNLVSSSGFASSFFTDVNNYKYFDTYVNNSLNTDYISGMYGDATKEVTYWNSDHAYFVYSSAPWFLRGGGTGDGSVAGVFAFSGNGSEAYKAFGTRAVLWVQ